jgi:hypothetical protein
MLPVARGKGHQNGVSIGLRAMILVKLVIFFGLPITHHAYAALRQSVAGNLIL